MAPQQRDMAKIAASGRNMTAPPTVRVSSPAVRDRRVEALDLDLVGLGPGAMIDLPKDSAIVGGQETWPDPGHLEAALRSAALCSSDPVCAGHAPERSLEERWLHGAACHGCALIAETSCEMRNDYLDRALVVPVIGVPGAAFFDPLA